jgi:transcription-repair coupling factor (superfamily II helicase)
LQTQERLLIPPALEFLLDDQVALPLEDGEQPSEFHLPLLHPAPASLLDYLPPQSLILIDDLQALEDSLQELEEQAVSLRQDSIQNGNLPPDFPIPYLSWSELVDSLSGHAHLALGPFTALPEGAFPLREAFSPGPRFGGRLKTFFDYLRPLVAGGDQVTIVSRQSSRLEELWAENAPPGWLPDPAAPNPRFIQDSLSEGWMLSPGPGQPRLHLLTDGEIFGWQRPQPRHRPRPVAQDPEAFYADLAVGDWVVHVDQGIGIFMGLVQRTIEGIENEYLCLEYAEGDQLYVPVYQADRVTRYVGPDGRRPTPSRLGGVEWRSAKGKAKEAVQEIAEELLDLYARRKIVQGFTFSADHAWQHELEAGFPYVETEDQLRVLVEVKQDMQAARPMDRLICGDVGYGKTEIALRAAFKAVMDGKQALMLVPTTVLAQQHYQTFQERLAPFPVTVEMLSRFRTPQEQQKIIERLRDGALDIVIGTHRLLSADVKVRDLGLLIIDEEQRFGVTHKEALKRMRTEVDVLTLTATPIPRTLYMALTGVRDISTLNTPPAERLPIITHVGGYAPRVVRQAILRELERGGQVFFVHNRVQTIGAMRQHLTTLVPEARLAIAHGQMPEQELSQRMQEFTAGQVDVLLCTSIIESGLDIPNANTLIIDRADTFGLAQLYQLRGRVGRGAQRAYAYFFRHNRIPPTVEGRLRLETIAENTQLGAGFSIAMRDLEIRGAGDLLGIRQHGHIAAVGFHLYTRLLAEAVRRLQPSRAAAPSFPGLSESQPSPVNVDLPIQVSIPGDYVADKNTRLRLYRRIADLRSPQEIENLVEEFRDRFGPPPEAVLNLLYQLRVKLLADQAGVTAIAVDTGLIGLRFPPLPEGQNQRSFPPLGGDFRVGKNGLWFDYRRIPDWKARLLEVLDSLAAWQR